MYIDIAVIASLVVLLICCAVVVYLGYYAWRKINSEPPQEESEQSESA
jgi:threonine/homoserine/homoserine lactone efflux protein